ncbi:MAG: RNA polymerase sigma factor [Oscillospiraceae bacterium]|nr:RNA polymerase sigma factor [Oscillospiraceae bacterium]
MTQEQLGKDVCTYRPIIYRLAFSCMGNRFDAEDVVQDTFLKLYQCKKDFADDEHKKAFLLRVASNRCKDLHKSAWFRKRADLDESLPAADCFIKSENTLREYVLRLKPAFRAVIFLFYYEGYSAAQIANILKMSETAVTTRLSRARRQLKVELINNKEELINEYI